MPERRRTPRRPVPERVRLLKDDGTPAPPRMPRTPQADVRRPRPSAKEEWTGTERRRNAAPRTPPAASRPRTVTLPATMTTGMWVFALITLSGLVAAFLWHRVLIGMGLAVLGAAGLIAPPRRQVDPRSARLATVLSASGVVLVAIGVVLDL